MLGAKRRDRRAKRRDRRRRLRRGDDGVPGKGGGGGSVHGGGGGRRGGDGGRGGGGGGRGGGDGDAAGPSRGVGDGVAALSLSASASAAYEEAVKAIHDGMIFGCKNETYDENMAKMCFGLPEAHLEKVKKINSKTAIFLLNYSNKNMSGIFLPNGNGGLNLIPDAWATNKNLGGGPVGGATTPFPAQVRVQWHKKLTPIHEHIWRCDAAQCSRARRAIRSPHAMLTRASRSQAHPDGEEAAGGQPEGARPLRAVAQQAAGARPHQMLLRPRQARALSRREAVAVRGGGEAGESGLACAMARPRRVLDVLERPGGAPALALYCLTKSGPDRAG